VLTLVLIVLSIWIAGHAAVRGPTACGMVIRFTARTSLLFFLPGLQRPRRWRGLWPNAWTRWQRRNRRYLGVTFAASHAIHAVAIVCFGNDGSRRLCGLNLRRFLCLRRASATRSSSRWPATSFDSRSHSDRPARPGASLHLTGGYYLLFQFHGPLSASGFPDMPLYGLFLIPLLAVMALRLIADGPSARPALVKRPAILKEPGKMGRGIYVFTA